MSDTTMMTYADAAKVLGIKIDSVKKRARTRKWHRTLSNDGRALIAVPNDIIPPDNSTDVTPDTLPHVGRDVGEEGGLAIRNAVLTAENSMLKDANSELRKDVEAWRNIAQQRRRWWPF